MKKCFIYCNILYLYNVSFYFLVSVEYEAVLVRKKYWSHFVCFDTFSEEKSSKLKGTTAVTRNGTAPFFCN